MVDLSEFEPETKRPCKFQTIDLTPENREKLEEVIDDASYSTYVIVKVLRRWGVPLATQTVNKHRKRDIEGARLCGCPD